MLAWLQIAGCTTAGEIFQAWRKHALRPGGSCRWRSSRPYMGPAASASSVRPRGSGSCPESATTSRSSDSLMSPGGSSHRASRSRAGSCVHRARGGQSWSLTQSTACAAAHCTILLQTYCLKAAWAQLVTERRQAVGLPPHRQQLQMRLKEGAGHLHGELLNAKPIALQPEARQLGQHRQRWNACTLRVQRLSNRQATGGRIITWSRRPDDTPDDERLCSVAWQRPLSGLACEQSAQLHLPWRDGQNA